LNKKKENKLRIKSSFEDIIKLAVNPKKGGKKKTPKKKVERKKD
jgi:hypothetical protein